MSKLFEPWKIRDVEFRNRVFVSPMCQYSSDEGMPSDWHLVHLGSRAVGGAAAVIVEATAVSPQGRISPWDSGLWSPQQARGFVRINRFIKDQGAVPGVQLAHAGRKASTSQPWHGGGPVPISSGGWKPMAPRTRLRLTRNHRCRGRDDGCGYRGGGGAVCGLGAIERRCGVRADRTAHGPRLSAARIFVAADESPHGQTRRLAGKPHAPAAADCDGSGQISPKGLPLFVRISATDWAEGGWDLPQSIELCKKLKEIGVDLIDCSSGGQIPMRRSRWHRGIRFRSRRRSGERSALPPARVGIITQPQQAEEIVGGGKADAVLLARRVIA